MTYRIALCLLAAPFLAQAQTTPVTCTAASLTGTYSFVLSGRDVTPTAALTKVYQGVGTITFDGVSAFTATLTTNTNVAPGVAQTLSGTYSIPSNCLGSLNLTVGGTATFTLIPYNKNNNFTLTGQDATYQFTGSGSMQPVACVTSTLSGGYAFSGNGFSLITGIITGTNDISGLLQFDGAGGVTGSWAIATSGSSTPDTVSGKYTLSSACVGTASVTDPSGVAYTLSYTVTSADGSNLTLLGASTANVFTSAAHSTFTNPGISVANGGGVTGGTPPGSLFSIYGVNLATGQAQPTSSPLPTTLANATVTVNGELAPLTYVSKTQINGQIPLDIAPGVATVVVKVGTTLSNSVAALVPATAVPGVSVYGANRAAAQNLPSYTLNTSTSPAPVGSVIVVYLTGGGPVQGGSSLVTGHATPNSTTFPVTESYSATIGGVPATVEFLGLAPGFVGAYQANILIPSVSKGDHTLIVTIGGTASNPSVVSVN